MKQLYRLIIYSLLFFCPAILWAQTEVGSDFTLSSCTGELVDGTVQDTFYITIGIPDIDSIQVSIKQLKMTDAYIKIYSGENASGTLVYEQVGDDVDFLMETVLTVANDSIYLELAQADATASNEYLISYQGYLSVVESVTAVSCYGLSDGEVSITPAGSGNYDITWDGTLNSNQTNDFTVTALESGTFAYTLTKSACIFEGQAVTGTVPDFTASISETKQACNSSDDAALTVTTSTAGTYSYAWDDAGVQTTVVATALTASTSYTCKVTKDAVCYLASGTTSAAADAISFNVVGLQGTCEGEEDGAATVLASGGSGNFSYNWNDESTDNYQTGLGAGDYNVTATDALGCSETTLVTIAEYTAVTVSTSSTASTGADDGTANITVLTGTSPYVYTWQGVEAYSGSDTEQDFTALAEGSYNYAVSDANTCSTSGSITVSGSDALFAGTIAIDASSDSSVCEGSAYAIQISSESAPSGGTGSYTYSWQVNGPGSSWNTLSGRTTDTLLVQSGITRNRRFRRIVTSGGSTAYTDEVTVYYSEEPDIYFYLSTSSFCENAEDTINLVASPASNTSYFSGGGVFDNASGTAKFAPAYYDGTLSASSENKTINYFYVDNLGCTYSANKTITLKKKPDEPSFELRSPLFTSLVSYQIDSAEISPLGGTFSGEGITSTGYISIDQLSYGTHTYTYNYTNSTTHCSNTTERSTVITDQEVSFTLADGSTFPSIVCYSGELIVVNATIDTSEFEPLGFEAPFNEIAGTSQGAFYPENLTNRPGENTIVYTYRKKGQSDVISYEQNFYLDYLGNVSIELENDSYCEFEAADTLVGTRGGSLEELGTFSLADASATGLYTNNAGKAWLKPDEASFGENKIYFTYVSQESYNTEQSTCSLSDSVVITIKPAADINFMVSDVCIKDTIQFVLSDTSTSDDQIAYYQWEFFDPTNLESSDVSYNEGEDAVRNPKVKYTEEGWRTVTLTVAEKNYGCLTEAVDSFYFEETPNPNFSWIHECEHQGGIVFTPASAEDDDSYSYYWDFGDGTSSNNYSNTHAYDAVDTYPVYFKVQSKTSACAEEITNYVTVRPTVKLSDIGSYQESFEDDHGGWVPETLVSDSAFSWERGLPSNTLIDTAYNGTIAYVTGLDSTYRAYETSALTSPCFDLTDVDRPMISFALWMDMENNRDGAVFQYRTNDSADWENIGDITLDAGLNWHNSLSINELKDISDREGWDTEAGTNWVLAAHDLDFLEDAENVRFRFAFAADDITEGEGIAIDNIKIRSRQRKVLVETFTNVLNDTYNTNKETVAELLNEIPYDVIHLEYHTSYPSGDPLYKIYPGGNNTRLAYYSIDELPYAVVDGTIGFSFESLNATSESILNQSLYEPFLSVNQLVNDAGGSLAIETTTAALLADSLQNRSLHLLIAVIAKELVVNVDGVNKTVENVLYRMLPDAAGTYLPSDWQLKSTHTSSLSYSLPEGFTADDFTIVAFIQDENTKEIMQAISTADKVNLTTTIAANTLEEQTFAVYPNPASDFVDFGSSLPFAEQDALRIYDQQGKCVKLVDLPKGESVLRLQVTDLEQGVYFVQLFTVDGSTFVDKLIKIE